MSAYYNEIDAFAANWLRNLITAGLICPGDIDERSIEDVHPTDIKGYTQCHFFAGIGVWSYALRQSGWSDDRQVWTGSCPCQPFSSAGKGTGFADKRHLWPSWFHLIEHWHPKFLFGEQSSSKRGLSWIDLVQDDLEGAGYSCWPFDLCAAGFGSPTIRQRTYFCATNAHCTGLPPRHESSQPRSTEIASAWREFERVHAASAWKEWSTKSQIPVFADGSANRVGRTRSYGNAINAEAAKAFITAAMECIP